MKQKPFEIVVKPNDNIFRELGNNTYDFLDLLSELVDNCVAARVQGELLQVDIVISISSAHDNSSLAIRDNASGIARDIIGDAISPAARRGTGLNEHGLGMKQAIASLGTLDHLVTKTVNDDHAIEVNEFRFGTIVPKSVDAGWEHGTEIRVRGLRPIVPTNPLLFRRHVVDQLGARYRRFLLGDDPKMRLTLQLVDCDSPNSLVMDDQVGLVKPVYFNPKTRLNEPSVLKKEFKGRGWTAELTFGYAPEDKEYEELGLRPPSRFHPYFVSLKNQGLDLIRNDRVISFHQLSEIGLIESRHNDFNLIRGELDMKRGFTTAITKNMVLEDQHFIECRDQIKEFLASGGYLRRKTYPGDIPESCLRDRLATWLRDNKLAPKKEVHIEFGVQGLDGNIDVLADGEAWELKTREAYGLDVYQLFAYLDMGRLDKGYLIAQTFRPSAHAAAEHIAKKHGKAIALEELTMYPITQPMTDEEREKYS